ncbi:ubiquitin-like-specific protease esd4 [Phtheirospermum japonicum]|uniref:Ubiquitin-like-specific protease esd4 n=1 Tax=Phtheirospermum japonicum TaxID=374723 RepID=A0A830BHW8_9LAMI|nr:ubiquitin-like-specific protease esd4 [Phtheirospermum japonicum]
MGALTNNRKRGDDYFKSLVSPSSPIESCTHITKKPRFSVSPAQRSPENSRPQSSNSIVSRLSQYPDRVSVFSREVHAPVRNSRFGLFSAAKKSETAASSSKESPSMGKFSTFNKLLKYEQAKDLAFRSFRYLKVEKAKEKEVIEVDSDDENRDGDVADDASVEEVKIVDVVGTKRKGPRGDIKDSPDFNVKTVAKEVRSLNSSVVTDASNNAIIAKLDDGDNSGLPGYKRLYNWISGRESKLQSLKLDIELHEKRRERFRIFRPQKKEEPIKKDVSKECFVPLTKEEENEVSYALSNSNRRKVLVTHQNSNVDITGEILQCLKPGAWLNDEVINLYLELLKEREKREPEKFLKCHFFNTFFYKKLISGRDGYNFLSVRRWTTQRKLGYSLLECDKIFVPIHQKIHWCLAVINKKEEKFQYLDSLKGADYQVLNALARYFVDEVKDKCGKDIDVSSWEQEFVSELPEQENGFDCGVFMIKYADFYSRDIGLCFSQENMPYFRRRTAKEVLKLRAD